MSFLWPFIFGPGGGGGYHPNVMLASPQNTEYPSIVIMANVIVYEMRPHWRMAREMMEAWEFPRLIGPEHRLHALYDIVQGKLSGSVEAVVETVANLQMLYTLVCDFRQGERCVTYWVDRAHLEPSDVELADLCGGEEAVAEAKWKRERRGLYAPFIYLAPLRGASGHWMQDGEGRLLTETRSILLPRGWHAVAGRYVEAQLESRVLTENAREDYRQRWKDAAKEEGRGY